MNNKIGELVDRIIECQALKDYITITKDCSQDETIDTQKVFKRRVKFTNKILLQTGTIIEEQAAREIVNNFLTVIDTTILKNCTWING